MSSQKLACCDVWLMRSVPDFGNQNLETNILLFYFFKLQNGYSWIARIAIKIRVMNKAGSVITMLTY